MKTLNIKQLEMKNIVTCIIAFIITLFSTHSALAIDVTELKLPKSNKVIIKLMFRNGSIADPADKKGLTYLTANTVIEGGTKEMNSTQLNDFLYPMAANFATSVDKEVTVFTFEVHKDFLSKVYPLIKGMITNPRFAEEDFSRMKSNQQNYVDELVRSTSDEDYCKKTLEDLLFRGTNYAHMVQGTSAGVKSITLEDVKSFYAKMFTVNNVSIGVAGNYTPIFLSNLLSDLQNLSPFKVNIPVAGKANSITGLNVEIIAKENALGSAIFAGIELPVTRSSDDFAALMIANSWLGEHRKSYSQLYKKIREERSMNYGDYSYIEWYDNAGRNMLPRPGVTRTSNYFSIWLRPVQIAKGLKEQYPELKDITMGHAHFALRMAMNEMQRLIDKGLSEADFELTRAFLRSYIKLYAQSPERQLGFMMDSKFYGRKDYLKEMDGLLAKITNADVSNVMKKYWQTQNMFISIVTDKSEAEPLKNSLENGTPSPMSYSDTQKAVLSKEILTEDEQVMSYPLKAVKVTIVDSMETFK